MQHRCPRSACTLASLQGLGFGGSCGGRRTFRAASGCVMDAAGVPLSCHPHPVRPLRMQWTHPPAAQRCAAWPSGRAQRVILRGRNLAGARLFARSSGRSWLLRPCACGPHTCTAVAAWLPALPATGVVVFEAAAPGGDVLGRTALGWVAVDARGLTSASRLASKGGAYASVGLSTPLEDSLYSDLEASGSIVHS
jgi:hypothetical protein